MDLTLLWLQLAAAAVVIMITAHFMARSADVIAEKTGLGRSFVGVVMLATATSLPELGTGVSSIVLVDEVDLAVGDAFGSNLFNLLIIGLLDLYWRRGPVLGYVSATSALVGALGILLIAMAAVAMILHSLTDTAAAWRVSPISVLMFAAFILAMYLIYRAEQERDSSTSERVAEDAANSYVHESLLRAAITYLLSAAIVVAAAVWLAHIGDQVTDAMDWEASFVGTQFLALSTSLPEFAASFAALRLGAPELAITNVLGSNLFNMGFVLFLDDVAFARGVLWRGIADIHILTALIAIVMTATVIAAVQSPVTGIRSRVSYSIEGFAMIVLYGAASAMVFYFA